MKIDVVSNLKSFINDERGAVTVDWVILTAAAVAMSVTAAVSIFGSSSDYSGLYGKLFYIEYMTGTFLPQKLGYECGYHASAMNSDC